MKNTTKRYRLVIGVLVGASFPVIPGRWMAVLVLLWVAGSVAGWVLWERTVWVPLIASIVVAALWMTAFFGSR